MKDIYFKIERFKMIIRIALVLIALIIISNDSFSQNSNKELHYIVSFPYINGFNIQGDDTTRTNWGFLGVSGGLDYGDSTRAWSLRLGASTDFFAPIGPADIEGTYSSSYGFNINLIRKRISYYLILINASEYKQRLELGYGINYSKNTWKKSNTFADPSTIVKTTNNSIGLTGQINFFIGKKFYIGYIYQPTFLLIDKRIDYQYQHLMSFDFGLRF